MNFSVYEKAYIYCPSCKTNLIRKKFGEKYYLACFACDFVFWNNPKPVVSVVVYTKEKRVLMLQRAQKNLHNYWCLPGGVVDYEETPLEAILREVYEETGLKLSNPLHLFDVYRIDNDPLGVTIDIIYHSLLEPVLSDMVTLSKEHKKYGFFLFDTLPNKVAYKHKEAVEDWYNKQ